MKRGVNTHTVCTVAVTKYPRAGGLHDTSLFPGLGAGLRGPGVGRAGSSRGLWLVSGHLLPVFSDGCPSVRVWVLVSSKTPGLRDQATLRPHVTPFKARSPDTVTLGGWASAYEFWGETVQSTALCIQTADVSNTSSWKAGEAEGWSFPMELSRLQVPAIQSGERRASESSARAWR